MPKIARTPPPNITTSESSILDALNDSNSTSANTNPYKRPRTTSSPLTKELHQMTNEEFKYEMKELLRIWKEDQSNNLSTMLTEQTALIKNLIGDINKLKSQNEEIKKTNEEIKTSIAFINGKYEEIKGEMEALKKDKQLQNAYIERLENKITDIQHRSRTSCIEIRNVPCSEK